VVVAVLLIAKIAKDRRNCFVQPKPPAQQVLNLDFLAITNSGNREYLDPA
jgi:hypothetical protein